MNIDQITTEAEVAKTRHVFTRIFAEPGTMTLADLKALVNSDGFAPYLADVGLSEVMGQKKPRKPVKRQAVSIEDRILGFLDREDDWACAEDISEALGVTQAYVSATLARMERDPEDMRVMSREERVSLKGPPTKFFKLVG